MRTNLLERGHNSRGFIDLRQSHQEGIAARSGSNSRLSCCKRVAWLLCVALVARGAANCIRVVSHSPSCKSLPDRDLREHS